jgi:hypothetical protein
MRLEDALGWNPGRPCRENVAVPSFMIVTRARPWCALGISLKKPKASHYPSFGRPAGSGALSRRETRNCFFSIESDFKETRSTSVSVECFDADLRTQDICSSAVHFSPPWGFWSA